MDRTQKVVRGDYIQGSFLTVRDPNGEVFSHDPGNLDEHELKFPFSYDHVAEAVGAGRVGFRSWRRIPASDRYSAVMRYLDLAKKRSEEIATALTIESGRPLWETREEMAETIRLMEYCLSQPSPTTSEVSVALDEASGVKGAFRYLPRGVMVVVSPSVLPLLLTHSHFVPALLHGNAVVIKSSKFAPYTCQLIAEIANDAGLPGGVLNLVHGDAELARRLVAHPDVQGVFFTGSHEKGLKIRKELVSDTGKTLILESPGKNAAVIWSDCGFRKALAEALAASYLTTGQRFTSTRRLFVHDSLFDKFVEGFHQMSKKCRIGYGLSEGDSAPFMGPMLSEAKMENYLRYQGIAVREGCEEIMRGKALEKEKRGYYVSPSIHIVTKPNPKSVYQKDPFFGPNVAIFRVHDIDETIDLINQSSFGLVASIYTAKREIFAKFLEDAQVGRALWNLPTTKPCYRLPVLGIKKAGNDRPMGSFAYQQCTYPMSSVEWAEPGDEPVCPPTLPGVPEARG